MNQSEFEPQQQHQQQQQQNQGQTNYDQSYKRKSDDSGYHGQKRQNSGSKSHEVHIKFLIPSPVAGSIIGKGGDRIAQIQNEANVRVKMSKANDYYPDTNERVCLVIGSIDSVLKAYNLIYEKINEKCENLKRSDTELFDRLNVIKLVIPNNTAGFLIGKGGAFVKQIKEDSGAHVQISSKTTDLPERTVTIEGHNEKRLKALEIVVNKIADDPLHSSVPNLNYSEITSSSSGSQHQQQQHSDYSPSAPSLPGSSNDITSMANFLAGLNNLALLIINCGGAYHMNADNLKNALRNAGYNSSASQEIIDSLNTLLKYGLISKTPPATLLESVQSGTTMPSLNNVLTNIVSSISNMSSSNINPSQESRGSGRSGSFNGRQSGGGGGGRRR